MVVDSEKDWRIHAGHGINCVNLEVLLWGQTTFKLLYPKLEDMATSKVIDERRKRHKKDQNFDISSAKFSCVIIAVNSNGY